VAERVVVAQEELGVKVVEREVVRAEGLQQHGARTDLVVWGQITNCRSCAMFKRQGIMGSASVGLTWREWWWAWWWRGRCRWWRAR
jgi:hypothetical protein